MRKVLIRIVACVCFLGSMYSQFSSAAPATNWIVELVYGASGGATTYSSPALGPDGSIYIGSGGPGLDLQQPNRLLSISPQGKINWIFITGGSVRASPAIGSDGTIYIGSADRMLYSVSLSGGTNLTLQGGASPSTPAIYNINSLSVQGNSTITINGPVVLNFAGNNIGTNPVINFTGGSLNNTSNIPGNLVINYGGTGTFNTAVAPPISNPTIIINGNSGVFASINAPNSNLKFTGGGNFYGAAVAETIDDQGGTNFFWDTSLNNTPNTSPYVEVSMRELSY